MRSLIASLSVFATMLATAYQTLGAPPLPRSQPPAAERAQYVAYYWRAKPGQAAGYNDYIKQVAEPIDESARSAGVFDEVHTYVPSSDGSQGEWTHLRVFKLRPGGTPESLSAGLDAASKRMEPDDAARARNGARAAELRDFVRREVWTELK